MTSIEYISLETSDTAAAERFYADAFGLDRRVRVTTSDAPTSGFRGFHISLIVSQPANVKALVDSAVAAGATTLRPVDKSIWGVGGVIQAPDGAIWKVATSEKKDTGPASRDVDLIVVLIGAEDVGASKKFYVEHGLAVRKSFGSYVDFDMASSPVRLGLYKRRALAKDAGVPPEGTGSHRIVFGVDSGSFTDPDGFTWQAASA
jgi:uncharacterized glyoxalase superfamily protein PhnB